MPHPAQLALLAALRQEKQITLYEMAQACGLTGTSGRVSVSAWEQGRSIPHFRRRSLFLRYLAVTLQLYHEPEQLASVWQILVDAWGWAALCYDDWQMIGQEIQHPAALAVLPTAALASRAGQPLTSCTPPMVPSPGRPLPPGSLMPFLRNPLFVGRDADLQILDRVLQGPTSARSSCPRTIALTGMGGIGKTQLAVEFIYRYGHAFDGGIFWINCADAAAIAAQIAACGGTNGLDLAPAYADLALDQQVQLVLAAWSSAAAV